MAQTGSARYRHWVFIIPNELRCYFSDNRWLCNKLIRNRRWR